MKARARLAFALAALALLACALLAAARMPARWRIELAREHASALSPRLAQALDLAPGEVSLVWFGSDAQDLPAGWRGVPEQVAALFAVLERRYAGRVRTQVFLPARDPELARFAARLGLAPLSARSITADGWSDAQVWSALRITVGPSGAAVLPALTPELAPALSELVAAQLEALRRPKRARVAIAAPDSFLRLRSELGARADVFESDFEKSARIAPETDLLVWLDPSVARPEHLRALVEHLAGGGSVWIAGSHASARTESVDGAPALILEEPRPALDALLPHFGLTPLPGLVLDRRAGAVRSEAERITPRVASVGEHQDFRALASEPGGTLFFVSPTALEPQAARLEELGYAFRPLACSGPRSFVLEVDAAQRTLPLAELEHAAGVHAGATALLVELVPADPWRGSLLVAGSSSPFSDGEIADESTAQRELVAVLARELASSERALRHGLGRERVRPLVELDSGRRWIARLAVCVAPALACALVAAFVAARRRGARLRALGLRTASLAAGLIALVGGLSLLLPAAWAADATRTGEHGLPAALVQRARALAQGAPLRIVCVFSPDENLPAELALPARRVRERAEELARAVPGLHLRVLRVPAGASEEELREPEGLVPSLRVTSQLDERTQVRFVHASLLVACGERRERLDFPTPADVDALDFRLAFALERALRGAAPVLAFAAGEERLAPAEALLEYERHGRFAPRLGTRFARARAALAQSGFGLADVDPEHPLLPKTHAALVWLAPRREVEPLGRELARELARGGRAFVALQHFRPRPERRSEGSEARAGSDEALVWWPEPQFPDLDLYWLPKLGLALPRELVADVRSGRAPFAVKLEHAGARSTLVRETLSSPLVVRAATLPQAGADSTDLVLPLPTRIECDELALARHGLTARVTVRASPAASARGWSGGPLTLGEISTTFTGACPRATLALRLTGSFPGPEAEPSSGAGVLDLCGSSEAFTDELLAAAPRNERFLVRSLAELVLPADLAQLAGAGATVSGLDPLPATERLEWRAWIAGGSPLILLVIGALLQARRRASPAVLVAGART